MYLGHSMNEKIDSIASAKDTFKDFRKDGNGNSFFNAFVKWALYDLRADIPLHQIRHPINAALWRSSYGAETLGTMVVL